MINQNPRERQDPTLATSSASPSRTKDFPRNIYSFSSEKAKRDLKSRSPRKQSSSSSTSSATSESLQSQIELFEQQNLFGPDFDVIEELTLNKERYVAYGPDREQITAYGVPSVVSYNLDRIKSRTRESKCGMNQIISCCVSFGVSQLYKDPNIRDLADFRDQLLDDHVANSGRDVIEFYDLLRSFKIDIPDDSGGLSSNKTTILIPEWLAQNLGGLASKLGAPKSSLVIICIMFTLAIQTTTIEAHRKQLALLLDKFLDRVKFRKRVAEVLLEELHKSEEV
jgi:hypothetical protein